MDRMKKQLLIMLVAMTATISAQAQTKRSADFKAKYQLKEVVVMSRHNIRSPLVSGGATYMRVTPYEWFKWTSPGSYHCVAACLRQKWDSFSANGW